jgi:type II secretory pathway pseudopilin PulG
MDYTRAVSRLPGSYTGFQACHIAGFQTRKAMGSAADLDVGATAGLEAATGPLGGWETGADGLERLVIMWARARRIVSIGWTEHGSGSKHGFLNMKKAAQHSGRGFSLLEVLFIIALVVILATLIFPVSWRDGRGYPGRKAQLESAQIAHAIHAYLSDCGKFPVSSKAMNAAISSGQDFTFGTYGLARGLKTPVGTYDVRALDAAGKPLSYQANNSEVMAVLLDIEFWPNAPTVPTLNQGHVMNPQKTRCLNAAMAANTSSPGIGPDGVYRDPWGQPYVMILLKNPLVNRHSRFSPSVMVMPRKRAGLALGCTFPHSFDTFFGEGVFLMKRGGSSAESNLRSDPSFFFFLPVASAGQEQLVI